MKLFTRESAAEILGVCEKLIDICRKEGLLLCSKIGNRVLIKEIALYALLDLTSSKPRTSTAARGELKVFDRESAGEFLMLSSSTIDRQRKAGLLNFSQIGDRVLFLEEDLIALLDATSSIATGGKI
jgi:hypothetical protein